MPRDVRDWKAYQPAVEETAPATVNQRLTAMTRLFRWVRSQGWGRCLIHCLQGAVCDFLSSEHKALPMIASTRDVSPVAGANRAPATRITTPYTLPRPFIALFGCFWLLLAACQLIIIEY